MSHTIPLPKRIDDPRYPLLSSALILSKSTLADFHLPRHTYPYIRVYRPIPYSFEIMLTVMVEPELILDMALGQIEAHLKRHQQADYIVWLGEGIILEEVRYPSGYVGIECAVTFYYGELVK